LEPKRPPSAYFLFAREQRDIFAKKYPGKEDEVAMKLPELWSKLTSPEKKSYIDKAEAAMQEYEEQTQIFRSLRLSGGRACRAGLG